MTFTIEFIRIYVDYIGYVAPLLLFFIFNILLLGQIVGRVESWSRFNAFYWSLITALTIGYGDIRPQKPFSKVVSILIGLMGIIFSGIVVAIAVAAAEQAFKNFSGLG